MGNVEKSENVRAVGRALEILAAFNARGIEFAFPTQTIHLHKVEPFSA